MGHSDEDGGRTDVVGRALRAAVQRDDDQPETVMRVIERVKELESIGVDQFNIYLMTHGQEETLQRYGEEIIPQFAEVAA